MQKTIQLFSAGFQIGGAIIGFQMMHFHAPVLHAQSQHLFEPRIAKLGIQANYVDALFELHGVRRVNITNPQIPKMYSEKSY